MSYLTVSLILLSVSFSVAAQLSLKHGMNQQALVFTDNKNLLLTAITNHWVLIGLACYGLSMVVWLYVLTKVEVSKAYPFVGLGFIGTMYFASVFLGESLNISKLMGTFLVVTGIVLLARA